MEIITILRRITEVMSTNPVNLVLTIVSHTLLLIGLVYTVIHLVKMMIEPEEKCIEVGGPIEQAEKLIV